MTCSCNVVSTSRDHADKNNKDSANSLENNEKPNKNLNPTKKPNEKTHNTENKYSNEKNRPLLKKERYRKQTH